MLKIHKLPTFALTLAFTAVMSLITAPAVLAVMFSLNGEFDDGSLFTGSFDYDFNQNQYTSFYINTKLDGGRGYIYSNDTNINSSLFGGTNGFTIIDSLLEYSLTLDFAQPLGTANFIQLNSTSQETFGISEPEPEYTRFVSSGNIQGVPYEFEPSLGLLLLIAIFGARQGWRYWHRS